jgi:hypothetical protein
MDVNAHPRPFPEWHAGAGDRAEDAAYTFGYHLITRCRDEAMATLPADASPELKAAVEKAVDTALHNVTDLLEGFWNLDAGPQHTVELALAVRVYDSAGNLVETQEVSPSKLDLPIGYWKWAQRREFR